MTAADAGAILIPDLSVPACLMKGSLALRPSFLRAGGQGQTEIQEKKRPPLIGSSQFRYGSGPEKQQPIGWRNVEAEDF